MSKNRPSPAALFALAAIFGCLMLMSPAAVQGNSGVGAVGVPDDWSHHHLVFSNPGSFAEAARNGSFDAWYRVASDPRYSMQSRKRADALRGVATVSSLQRQPGRPTRNTWWKLSAGTGLAALFLIVLPGRRRYRATLGLGLVCLLSFGLGCAGTGSVASNNANPAVGNQPGDWSMTLGNTGKVGAGQFPAKYSFFTNTAPNCASAASPDYVVYNTGLAGTVTQATIVAYDNLYATTCAGTVPAIYWAYNTGGTVSTSPIISFHGDQVGFVQTTTGVASLVLLKWANSGGTVGAPAAITSVTNAAYRACTAPCYTTLLLNGSPNDTNSPPFYVYDGSDTMYVGDDSGKLHKFTNVFQSAAAPTEVLTAGAPWVSVSANKLTGAVYDSSSKNVFVADSGGFLYSYAASTGALVGKSSQLAATGSKGIVAPPLVDSSANTMYVFVGQDGSTTAGDKCANATGCDGVFRFSTTTFTTSGTGICGSTNGTSWTSGTNCGVESVFGVGTANTILYSGAFDNAYYATSGSSGNLYSCGATGTPAPKLVNSSMASFASTVSATNNVINPLTSATATCSPVTEIPGTKALTTLSGAMTAGATTATVASGTGTANGDYIQIDSEIMHITAGGGTTTLTVTRAQNGTTPVAHSSGAAVTDIQDWIFLGVSAAGTGTGCAGACIYNFNVNTVPAAATAGQAATGGTSGIIVDNTSTATGASQVYYSTLANQACVGNGTTGNGTGGCAVQTLQSAP